MGRLFVEVTDEIQRTARQAQGGIDIMAEKSGIGWTRSTFNPVIGCTKVGPGCDNCYAEVSTPSRSFGIKWGAGQPRYVTSDANWKQPLAWNKKAAATGEFWPVFCASLADVFDNEWPDGVRDRLWALIRATPYLTWQIVTKRIGNAAKMLPAGWGAGYQNVWLIITVCNQDEADRDIPKLLTIPAVVHGVSYEPAIGPINFRKINPRLVRANPFTRAALSEPFNAVTDCLDAVLVNWVIIGGESRQGGAQARPFNIEWARNTIEQCKTAGVACFVKQLGSHPVSFCTSPHDSKLYDVALKDRAGADPSEWGCDIRVQEFPDAKVRSATDEIQRSTR